MRYLIALFVLFCSSASAQTIPGYVTAAPAPAGTNGQLQYNNLGTMGGKNLVIAHEWYVATNGSDTNPCTYDAPCATISYANSIALPGDDITVFRGSYTDNVTLKASVSITCAEARQVFINGTLIASYSGTTYIHHCDLQTTTGNVLIVTGTNATNISLHDVHFDGQSGAATTISYSNTNAASKLTIVDGAVTSAVTSGSIAALATAGAAAGSIQAYNTTFSALDDPTHIAINLGGSVSMVHVGDVVRGQINVADTAVYSGTSMRIDTGTVASLVTNSASATPSSLTNVIHTTSAHPLVTGAGAFAQGLNVFAGTGYDFAATLSGGLGAFPVPAAPIQFHAGTLLPAGGLASGLLDGTLEHDASHLYVDLVTARYQLDQQLVAGSAPTAAGGGGTCATGAIAGNKQSGTITLTGACNTTNTITLTFTGAATTGFNCFMTNRDTPANVFRQTSVTSTTVSVFTATGSASGATDVLQYMCLPY